MSEQKLKMIWLGNHFFHKELPADLVECCYIYPKDLQLVQWDDLVAQAGFQPDVLVVADCSSEPFILGVETLPCLTVFYAVDTHIHSWYPMWGQSFDLCLISLKDHIPHFQGKWLQDDAVLWFPPYAPMFAQPKVTPVVPVSSGASVTPGAPGDKPDKEEKLADCIFLGRISRERTPKRYVFINELQKRFSGLLVDSTGHYPDLYAKAKLALNFCEYGDLNFRVAETLACEKCLITPHVQHGLTDLFIPGEDLFTYDVENMDGLIQTIHNLLANPELCSKVAKNGYLKVNAGHRATHRAAQLAQHLKTLFESGAATKIIDKRLKKQELIHRVYLKLLFLHLAEATTNPLRQKAYFAASNRQYIWD